MFRRWSRWESTRRSRSNSSTISLGAINIPVFDFKCVDCATVVEAILIGSDKAPTKCPECKGKLKRIYSGRIATQFNAWGFSKTDGWVPPRKDRKDFKTLKDKASELFD